MLVSLSLSPAMEEALVSAFKHSVSIVSRMASILSIVPGIDQGSRGEKDKGAGSLQ